jgi:thiol-disulfide isomerase/thioredoxin
VTTGAWVLLVSVLLAIGFGVYRAATDGRFRGTHRVRGVAAAEPTEAPTGEDVTATPPVLAALDVELGERATLLQFSTAFCAPCRATRRILDEVTALVPGVNHVEIDAEHHLDAVRALGVLRTPTTLVLAADGHEITRAAGAPSKAQVLAALEPLLPNH